MQFIKVLVLSPILAAALATAFAIAGLRTSIYYLPIMSYKFAKMLKLKGTTVSRRQMTSIKTLSTSPEMVQMLLILSKHDFDAEKVVKERKLEIVIWADCGQEGLKQKQDSGQCMVHVQYCTFRYTNTATLVKHRCCYLKGNASSPIHIKLVVGDREAGLITQDRIESRSLPGVCPDHLKTYTWRPVLHLSCLYATSLHSWRSKISRWMKNQSMIEEKWRNKRWNECMWATEYVGGNPMIDHSNPRDPWLKCAHEPNQLSFSVPVQLALNDLLRFLR